MGQGEGIREHYICHNVHVMDRSSFWGPEPPDWDAWGPGSLGQGSGEVGTVRWGPLQGLLTLPLPNSLTLDHLDHPPHLESGTGNIFASCIASLKKNSISTHLSSPLYVLLYFYIGKLLTFWWRQHFHVNFPPWSSCLMHSCFPHVREKAIRRVSLAIIFPYWVT